MPTLTTVLDRAGHGRRDHSAGLTSLAGCTEGRAPRRNGASPHQVEPPYLRAIFAVTSHEHLNGEPSDEISLLTWTPAQRLCKIYHMAVMEDIREPDRLEKFYTHFRHNHIFLRDAPMTGLRPQTY